VTELKRFSANLQTLRVSCKIEDAKFSTRDGGFSFLIGKIDVLKVESEEKLKEMEFLYHRIVRRFGQGHEKIRETGDHELKNANRLILDLKNLMGSLQEQNVRAEENAEQTSHLAVRLAENTGECVASLQFQDITRQQLEHVSSALLELEEMDEEDSDFQRKQVSTLLLQHHQIEFTRDELGKAIRRLMEHLEEMNSHSHCIDDNAIFLQKGHCNESSHFVDEMRLAFQRIQRQNEMSEEVLLEFERHIQTMAEDLKEFQNSLKKINGIGETIHMIALNARIVAHQYGERGHTLGVIAESIQQLSNDTKVTVSSLTDELNQIDESGSRISQSVTDGIEDEKRNQLISSILDSFSGRESAQKELLIGLREQCRELENHIKPCLEELSAHTVCADLGMVSEDILTMKACAVEGCSAAFQEKLEREIEAELEAFENSYTMETERQVHQLVVEGRRSEAPEKWDSEMEPVTATASGDNEESDDWDNVELF
jgi:methyl-accepting chemotaxis protein